MKNITKISTFVILAASVAGCSSFSSGADKKEGRNALAGYSEPRVTGKLRSDDLIESSGIAASKCQQDVFWSHNDSGDGPFIFAIDSKGDNLGVWNVQAAENIDWEDISAYKDGSGRCYLYIGEIGNNKGKRSAIKIYKVAEPPITDQSRDTDKKHALNTEPATALSAAYPDGIHNAETMMVNPLTGDIYVLTKNETGPSGVYKIKGDFAATSTVPAQKLADIRVPAIPYGFLTGGDVSPDARRVILCDYSGGYELRLPDNDSNFDDVWSQKPIAIDLGERKQGEAVGYTADGKSIIVTSEDKHSAIIEIDRIQ